MLLVLSVASSWAKKNTITVKNWKKGHAGRQILILPSSKSLHNFLKTWYLFAQLCDFFSGDDLKSTNDEISVASTSDGLEEYLIENVDTLISQLNDFEEIGILSPRALFSLMFLSVREDDLSSYTSICTPLLRVLISPSFRSFCPATFYSNFILLCQKLLERVDVVRENTEAVHSLILACLLFIKERTEALPPDRLLDTTLSMLILAKEDVAVESRAVKTWPTALRLIVTRIFRTREISLEIIDKVIAIVSVINEFSSSYIHQSFKKDLLGASSWYYIGHKLARNGNMLMIINFYREKSLKLEVSPNN